MRLAILSAVLITAAVVPVSAEHSHRTRWADEQHAARDQSPQIPPSYHSSAPSSAPGATHIETAAQVQPTRKPPLHWLLPEERDNVYTYIPDSSSINPIATLAPGNSSASSSAPATTITRATNFTLPRPPSPIPGAPPDPIPTPLDTTAGSLKGSCLKWITNLTVSDDFRNCLPFSLLLTSSAAFAAQIKNATASGNYSYMNQLLAYASSPQPSAEQCDNNYADFYKQISSKANCGAELSSEDVIKRAQVGMGNYQVMRTAASLVNPKTGVYCYLDAIATAVPADLYLWTLPAGLILPQRGVTPTCSACSALLMNHYAAYMANTTTINVTTIAQAAEAINNKCGAGFVPQPAAPTKNSNAFQLRYNSGLWLMVSIISLGLVL